MTKRPSRVTLAISGIAFWAVAFAPSLSTSETSSDAKVLSSLQGMGYSDIFIDGCTVSFSRETVPTEGNNYLTKYDRHVNLRTLDLSEAYEVRGRATDHGYLYIAEVPLKNKHYQYESQIYSFRSWVRRNYPKSNWPHTSSNIEGHEAAEIEAELWNRLPQIKYMNWWTSHWKTGSLTLLPPVFRMTYHERSNLVLFRDALIDHSVSYHCSNPNEERDT